MSVLKQYQINFGIQKIHNTDYKFMESNNFILSNLINEFSTERKSDLLLDSIQYIEDHPQEGSVRWATDGLQFIEIFPSVVKIYTDMDHYQDQSSIPDLVLPTSDFKEITSAWSKFINNNSLLL
ncbi:hypothetical protein AOB46_02705 [Chryseobacterium indologenes]|uniref:Uncharacterized protein n=1 Tax=Chryseobacterium indologenes TaxID=253 RepID=A0A0N1KTM8_CHRID|nr:hypothetical protein AOB46_02705 [Chryseobacterium indologenes]